jgi:NAD(P)H dehydrogenase (quinone)
LSSRPVDKDGRAFVAFVAPVHFLSFPAILKGWLDRVWTPAFAYDLTEAAWRGDINGRQPRLTHTKASILAQARPRHGHSHS